MKKVACFTLIGALGLFGCGGDDDDGGDDISVTADAAPGGTPDAAPAAACNPVSQMGCEADEKCGFVLIDEATRAGGVACVPDGSTPLGGACTSPQTANTSDDCVAGGWCIGGACVGMCSDTSLEGCEEMEACIPVNGVTGVAACIPNCDPLAAEGECPSGQACYLSGQGGVCLTAGDLATGTENCMFLNDCAPGNICIGDPSSCRPLCGEWSTCEVLDDQGNAVNILDCGDCAGNLVKGCPLTDACVTIVDSQGAPYHPTTGVCLAAELLTVDDVPCDCAEAPGICPDPATVAPTENAGMSLPNTPRFEISRY